MKKVRVVQIYEWAIFIIFIVCRDFVVFSACNYDHIESSFFDTLNECRRVESPEIAQALSDNALTVSTERKPLSIATSDRVNAKGLF